MNELVVVANRLPVEQRPDGSWSPSPGGLASALSSVLSSGAHWIGWGGPATVGDADDPKRPAGQRITDLGAMQAGPDDVAIELHAVELDHDEVEEYYHGFANDVLWPLFHGRLRRVELNRSWWRAYRRVNARFANAAARVTPPGGMVWVHDYHLLLAPAMIRRWRPDVRIGLFLHIPFPNVQLISVLPWRRELIEGMLGADVLGFQVADDADNFRHAAERLLGTESDADSVIDGRHRVEVDHFPISVDVGHWASLGRQAAEHAAQLRAQLDARHVLLGVDRLDYTKGITQRLEAFGELLDDQRLDPDDCVFVQIAVPSRSEVPAYQHERDEVESLVAAINAAHPGRTGSGPLRFIHDAVGVDELAAWYRAADVLVVTSLADGMNLVAKEFVAARTDLAGSLVLSEFAGAAHDLDGALIVNPYDIEAIKKAILEAIEMPRTEQIERLRTMRAGVEANDVHRWARRFLERLSHQPHPRRRAEQAH